MRIYANRRGTANGTLSFSRAYGAHCARSKPKECGAQIALKTSGFIFNLFTPKEQLDPWFIEQKNLFVKTATSIRFLDESDTLKNILFNAIHFDISGDFFKTICCERTAASHLLYGALRVGDRTVPKTKRVPVQRAK